MLNKKNTLTIFLIFCNKGLGLTQYSWDLNISNRSQMDIWCIFKDFDKKRIEKIFSQLCLKMDFKKTFFPLYKKVTTMPYFFLYINKRNSELRSNFNEKILIKL